MSDAEDAMSLIQWFCPACDELAHLPVGIVSFVCTTTMQEFPWQAVVAYTHQRYVTQTREIVQIIANAVDEVAAGVRERTKGGSDMAQLNQLADWESLAEKIRSA